MMSEKKISILLVDDHHVVREGFRRLIETESDMAVVGEAACGETGLIQYFEQNPDVVLLDLSMPGEGGMGMLRRLIQRDEEARVLVLSMHEDSLYITRIFALGAKGYISKSGDPDLLPSAIRAIYAGENWIDPKLAQNMVLHANDAESVLNILSQREFEIFCLMAEGHSISKIAQLLHIAEKTAGTHRTRVMRKLELGNLADLTRLAVRLKVIEL
ncbi:MAG: response regulator transcription factor [Mariprofundaceae bacterium]